MAETLQQRITRHEGVRLSVYKDTLGNFTIGIGRLISATDAAGKYVNGITLAEASAMLNADITQAIAEVKKDLPWSTGLSSTRQSVLYELAFWVGIGGLLRFKKMLAALQVNDYVVASNELLDSLLHKQAQRRTEELVILLRYGSH